MKKNVAIVALLGLVLLAFFLVVFLVSGKPSKDKVSAVLVAELTSFHEFGYNNTTFRSISDQSQKATISYKFKNATVAIESIKADAKIGDNTTYVVRGTFSGIVVTYVPLLPQGGPDQEVKDKAITALVVRNASGEISVVTMSLWTSG